MPVEGFRKDNNLKVDRSNFDSNIRFLEKTGLIKAGVRILEVGCGAGRMIDHLTQNGYHAIGFDISRKMINEGRVRYPNAITLIASGDKYMPFKDASFDIVMSFDVLEHIPNTDEHLQEIKRILKPRGYYLLQTPNKWTNLPFEIMKNRSLTEHRGYHCSLYNYWQLKRIFEKNSFSSKFYKITVVNDFFKEKIREQFGILGLMALRIFNPDVFPYFLKTNFYFETRRLEDEDSPYN